MDPPVLRLTSFVISVDPKISVVPSFLSLRECRHLIDVAETAGFARSLVGRGTYSTKLENGFSENRTSLSVTLEPFHDSIVELIEHRLAGLVGRPLHNLESLVVVKYEPGQYFKTHMDGVFREYTVFIYLNDLPENAGGETYFPSIGLRVKPRVGTAVLWRNSSLSKESGDLIEDDRLIHEGKPPLGCTKYGVNCFFNYNCMRRLGEADNKENMA